MKRRIAIIGGGGMGVCTALELANHGHDVHIFEANCSLVKKASYANEGKIHTGLIYAMDTGLQTAKEMIRGGLHFIDYLNRWIDLNPEEILSTPFYYLNHSNSLLGKEQLMTYYKSCQKLFQEASAYYDKKYLDLFGNLEIELLDKGIDEFGYFNPEFVDALFKTNEYAVDVRQIAALLRSAAIENEHVTVYLESKVTDIRRIKNSFELSVICGKEQGKNQFDIVVNSSWNSLLELDRQLGIHTPYKWSFRYKLATRVVSRFLESDLPSVTIVQGAFGDIVNFKNNGLYYSWYPISRMGWSEDIMPPAWDQIFSHAKRLDAAKRSFAELCKIIPGINTLRFEDDAIDPVGGCIFALGNNDIDLIQSRLHTRHEIGIKSKDNYHSVNTGKYTSIPLLAVELASRIIS